MNNIEPNTYKKTWWLSLPIMLSVVFALIVIKDNDLSLQVGWAKLVMDLVLCLLVLYWLTCICMMQIPHRQSVWLFSGVSIMLIGTVSKLLVNFLSQDTSITDVVMYLGIIGGALVASIGVWYLAAEFALIVNKRELKKEQFEHLSITDNLTSLYNSRYFRTHAERLVNECKSKHLNLCLLILDIDNLKQYNQTWGHFAGDEVISTFGRFINGTIEGEDMGFRYGGKEIAILLVNVDKVAALKIAERTRMELSLLQFRPGDEDAEQVRLTVSGGLSQLKKTDDISSFISRADSRLNSAREHNQNTIVDQ